ncbi:flagellar export chaperone FliS [Chitinilyticum litopenaei]|uniref:Flagellar secretion chaperone FliS n=2 Tax=Chitinilyticum piscinae TaxID=2866724 RepID=A0A8J7FQG7_9NEIS|nr:flagellar export chaperone FliS [Chitinilyticum piscinae]
MINKKAMAAYGAQSLDADVAAASPHRLIILLYDGAIQSVTLARMFMENGSIAEKGAAISKAIAIIEDGLRLSLDRETGGELADNLDALYEYMSHVLLEANLHNRLDSLDQILILLKDLREAWESIPFDARHQSSAQVEAIQHGRV